MRSAKLECDVCGKVFGEVRRLSGMMRGVKMKALAEAAEDDGWAQVGGGMFRCPECRREMAGERQWRT